MAGSEELDLREDTVRVLAAFFRRGPATPDFYALVAQRLEQLVQEQLRSPPSPELQGAPPTEKEALLRKLVALLEEEAEVINQKVTGSLFHPLARIGIADCWALGSEPGSAFSLDGQLASDPALRRKLARLSAGSFARLVELFSSREDSPLASRPRPTLPCPGPPPPSPEPLARLALAMELSRRVARLGGTLAGLSVEHVHSFGPWIQAHGGWEGILAISPVDLNLPLD
ncbi:bcl-2-like protein 12 isoform X3 [Halichoerus grypus]|uniref:bcl-2-like protein 12 isoform X3 n=1 Tax=Halichoerus grypus TaxID=9711 RepID=UPI001659F7EE|nr:bcl-2-like protein 12 isoform X3 [Halichoerus grypus]